MFLAVERFGMMNGSRHVVEHWACTRISLAVEFTKFITAPYFKCFVFKQKVQQSTRVFAISILLCCLYTLVSCTTLQAAQDTGEFAATDTQAGSV